MKQYAPYGSAKFNKYIHDTLNNIAKRFDEMFSREELIALVLGGGYGRSEGGVLKIDTQEKLYNDLDFFVIGKELPGWKSAQISRQLMNLHYELSDQLGIEVDFSDIKAVSNLAKAPISLMWFDLKCGHEVIWGNKHVLQNMPRWEASDLGVNEAVKLLLNRGMGLYFARSYILQHAEAENSDFINRNIHKAYQAIAEAILITEENYHWSVMERMKRIENTNIARYSANPLLASLMQEAMEFKLRPHILKADEADFADRISEAIAIFEEVYYAVWAAYFGVPKLDLKSYHNLLSSYKDMNNSVMSLAKNFALNLRDCGLNPVNLNEYIKYPRYRLFYALPWLLFDQQMSLESISRMLGLPGVTDRSSLEQRYVALWQRYN